MTTKIDHPCGCSSSTGPHFRSVSFCHRHGIGSNGPPPVSLEGLKIIVPEKKEKK